MYTPVSRTYSVICCIALKKVFLMKNALREAKISSSMLHHGVYSDKDSRFRSGEGIWPIISTLLWIIKVLFSPRYPVPWVLTQWFCHLLYFTQIKSFIMYFESVLFCLYYIERSFHVVVDNYDFSNLLLHNILFYNMNI